ncbi:MAG: VWA domain-containing protein [Deltaproteobacteria bacterium]|nr:VWA domain-containing protein [Deltaproteobacteria bacterium]
MDAALSWLYGRERDVGARDLRERSGGLGPSQLTVPEWLESIHRLFPKETIERLERDAVERYGIDDVVTNPAVLERVTPNETLLRAVLRTKHLMKPDVLAQARKLIAAVVRQLMEKLAKKVRQSFSGTVDRRRASPLKSARNFDFKKTIRDNLARWSPEERRLYLEKAHFFARTKRHTERWQVILLVDQSGSMTGSVIHSAVTAACLWSLPGIRAHLVAFDTEVVDLTADVSDPVELLLKVQLGGGTDIAKAVMYGSSLVDVPRRAIVVLITDFFEGGDPGALVRTVRALCAQGTRVLGLAALDEEANPVYDRDLAQHLVDAGAEVGAMTPGELAGWIAEKVRS